MPDESPNPVGRPSEFKPEFIQKAAEMCANGATDAELADEFGVTVRTIYSWRIRYPEFLHAIKTNKPLADERVERSLFERATGYERDAVKIFLAKDGTPVTVTFREHVPPDPTSMIFWLKNRKPTEWRDKTPGDSADNPLHLGLQIISSVPRPKQGE